MSTSDTPLPPPALRPPADLNPRPDAALDFQDKDLSQMTPRDYDAIGFLCGLEVHQQLQTRTKLFCRCPAGRYVDRFDAEVLRHMRPTLSELGEYDGCALMEFKTRKEIVYLLERGTVCTYEMDDTPPFEIDEEAVRISLLVARLFNLDLVSELHVMRKQYLDGSIPTGFQRTAMVGLTGEIPFRVPELGVDKPLRIRQLSLEEDSCREISDVGHRIVFRTDRLGMPLIETVTEPDFLTPWEVREGGRLLARVARSSGMVRRGPGAARQDVNVSVAGGRRVEIKGVPYQAGLPLLVHNEGFRQLNLLRIKDELLRRGVTRDHLTLPERGRAWEMSSNVLDVGSILRRCEYEPIVRALEGGDRAIAVLLPGFAGLLRHRTQPGITFAREFHGRVRVIACLTARPFMIHSDLTDYGIGQRHWKQVRKAFRAAAQDAIMVVWGPADDVDTAAREILLRAIDALAGVPAETRQCYGDGTTGFERILPGADRMYPDTDTPPLAIPDAWVPDVVMLPERPWQREDRYVAAGLTLANARRLTASPWAALFDELAPRRPETARRLAAALEKRVPEWRRRGALPARSVPEAGTLRPIVDALDREEIRAEAFEPLVARALGLAVRAWREISLEGVRERRRDAATEDAAVALAVRHVGEARTRDAGARLRFALGVAMRHALGAADPAALSTKLAAALSAAAPGLPQRKEARP